MRIEQDNRLTFGDFTLLALVAIGGILLAAFLVFGAHRIMFPIEAVIQ